LSGDVVLYKSTLYLLTNSNVSVIVYCGRWSLREVGGWTAHQERDASWRRSIHVSGGGRDRWTV